MSKRHHEPMRNFALLSLVVTISGFVLTNQATTSAENSSFMEGQRTRAAQLCQLDSRYCRDI